MTQMPFQPLDNTPKGDLDGETLFFDHVAEQGENDKAMVEVGRYDMGDYKYLRKYVARDFNKDQVQEAYGAGKYRAQMKVNGRFTKSCTFHVGDGGGVQIPRRPDTPVAGPSPAAVAPSNDLVVAILREELAGMRNTLNTMLAARPAESASDRQYELMVSLLADRSGPNQLLQAMKMLEQIKGDGGGKSDGGEAKVWSMLEKLADKVLSGRPKARPVENTAAPAAPQTRPQETPVAAAAARKEPHPILAEIGAVYGLPLEAMVQDLTYAAVSDQDAETAGMLMYRRAIKAKPAASFTEAQAKQLDELDATTAGAQIGDVVKQLKGHEGYAAAALENCLCLILGDIEDAKKGGAA